MDSATKLKEKKLEELRKMVEERKGKNDTKLMSNLEEEKRKAIQDSMTETRMLANEENKSDTSLSAVVGRRHHKEEVDKAENRAKRFGELKKLLRGKP